jgi:aminomethyltransferase
MTLDTATGATGAGATGALATTPLYDIHVALGAKIVPFAGYRMPVQYPTGATAEHVAVREGCGLFDVSHMGEIVVTGPEAVAFVDLVTSNNASRLSAGQAQYSTILTPAGTIVDDCLVYRFRDTAMRDTAMRDTAMLVVNASNRAGVLTHLYHYADRFDCAIDDASDRTALLALQGPRAQTVLAPLTPIDLDTVRYYHFVETTVATIPVVLSRTGYTGEDGFELYVASDDAAPLWAALIAGGGVTPAGLAARDSLRLEMGMPLYGHEIDGSTTPLEAGLGWVVDLAKPSFIGRDALLAQRAAGPSRKLVGFRAAERAVPRQHYPIFVGDTAVSQVLSGAVSPTLGVPIGTCYLPVPLATVDSALELDIRGKRVAASVVRLPFVPRRTRR